MSKLIKVKYRYKDDTKRKTFFNAYRRIKKFIDEDCIIEISYKPNYPNFEGTLIYVDTLKDGVYKSFSVAYK